MPRHIASVLSVLRRAGHGINSGKLNLLFSTEKRRCQHYRELPNSVQVKQDLPDFVNATLSLAGIDPETVTETVAVRGGKQRIGRYLKANVKVKLSDDLIQAITDHIKSRTVTVEFSRSFLDILSCSDEGIATTFRSCYCPGGQYDMMPLAYAALKEVCVAVVRRGSKVVWRSLCFYHKGRLYMSEIYTDNTIRLTQAAVLSALGIGNAEVSLLPPAGLLRKLKSTGWVDNLWWTGTAAVAEHSGVVVTDKKQQSIRVATMSEAPSDARVHITKSGFLVISPSQNLRVLVPHEMVPDVSGFSVYQDRVSIFRIFGDTLRISTDRYEVESVKMTEKYRT